MRRRKKNNYNKKLDYIVVQMDKDFSPSLNKPNKNNDNKFETFNAFLLKLMEKQNTSM